MADAKKPDYIKLVEPYIQRAQETKAVDPVVSYFCKYYAARLAITSNSSNDRDTYLAQLLDQLEAEKQSIGDHESMRDDTAAAAHVTSFALRVFARADTEDREGRASKVTAKTFIVASQFLQVLASFGEVPPDVAEKIKYAKWRAMEILKAAREGRAPVAPAGPKSDDDILAWPSPPAAAAVSPPPIDTAPAGAPSAAYSAPGPSVAPPSMYSGPAPAPPPSAYSGPTSTVAPPSAYSGSVSAAPAVSYPDPRSMSPASAAPPPITYPDPRSISPPNPTYTPPVSSSPAFIPVPAANLPPPVLTSPGAPVDLDQMLDPLVAKKAQKLARWAISALEYDDVTNAIENLQEAIRVLLPYKN
ncbi:hypothetical protein GGI24_005743 [Coemansia furcata]|nr:hypothetical protein GGI24_005743 [Coemansia furcata]